jgi:hypothetical protein
VSYGQRGPTRVKRLRGVVTADDLVNRKFHRAKNELWVTDITEHPSPWIPAIVATRAMRSRDAGEEVYGAAAA